MSSAYYQGGIAAYVLVVALAGLFYDLRGIVRRTPGATLPAHLRTWALVRDPERRTQLVWAARVLYGLVAVYLLHHG
jgi:hypothetical protein